DQTVERNRPVAGWSAHGLTWACEAYRSIRHTDHNRWLPRIHKGRANRTFKVPDASSVAAPAKSPHRGPACRYREDNAAPSALALSRRRQDTEGSERTSKLSDATPRQRESPPSDAFPIQRVCAVLVQGSKWRRGIRVSMPLAATFTG